MEKKNITLSAISVDVEIQPDNTLDAYISTEGSSGAHYQNVSAEVVAENVQDLIECLAESALENTDRCLAEAFPSRNLRGGQLQSGFERYLEHRRYLYEHGNDASESVLKGACEEAEKWLDACGCCLDEARITDLVKGYRKPYQHSIDLLKATDQDYVFISAETFQLSGVCGYLVGWLSDNEEDEDNIAAYLLFVPVLNAWCDDAKRDVLFAEGLEDNPECFHYAMAATDGPKVVLYHETDTDSGAWNSMKLCAELQLAMCEYVNSWSRCIDEDILDGDSERALSEIVGL